MPPDPPAARAFGARNLPRLVLKSGYGPGYSSKSLQYLQLNYKIILYYHIEKF